VLESKLNDGKEPINVTLKPRYGNSPMLLIEFEGSQCAFELHNAGNDKAQPENLDGGTLLVQVFEHRDCGYLEPEKWIGVRLITGQHTVTHEYGSTTNVEYWVIKEDFIKQTQHNREHLIRDDARRHSDYRERHYLCE